MVKKHKSNLARKILTGAATGIMLFAGCVEKKPYIYQVPPREELPTWWVNAGYDKTSPNATRFEIEMIRRSGEREITPQEFYGLPEGYTGPTPVSPEELYGSNSIQSSKPQTPNNSDEKTDAALDILGNAMQMKGVTEGNMDSYRGGKIT